MLNTKLSHCRSAGLRGFSLIEMMIAMLIGSIVAVGALVLIFSINQANSLNIQSMRINQELRSLASVISDELKRSRRTHDPMALVGTGVTSGAGAFDNIVTSTSGCIKYGYMDASQNDPSSTADVAAGVNYFRAISLDTTTNQVMLASVSTGSSTTSVACPTSTTTGAVALNSAQIRVTSLTFNCITYGTSVTTNNAVPTSCAEIDMTVQATPTFQDRYTKAVAPTYTYTQAVFIRSGAT